MIDEGRYRAYLVRLWTVHRNGDVVWRASAENAHTGDQHVFADLAGLCAFLWMVTADNMAAAGQGVNSVIDAQMRVEP